MNAKAFLIVVMSLSIMSSAYAETASNASTNTLTFDSKEERLLATTPLLFCYDDVYRQCYSPDWSIETCVATMRPLEEDCFKRISLAQNIDSNFTAFASAYSYCLKSQHLTQVGLTMGAQKCLSRHTEDFQASDQLIRADNPERVKKLLQRQSGP